MLEIKILPDGSLYKDHNNDLGLSSGKDALAENIMIRLKTRKDSAFNMPGVGSDIHLLLGYPNNRSTGELLESYALEALTRDGFLDPSQVDITAVPITESVLSLFIDLQVTPRQQLAYSIDLTDGSINT